MMERVKTDPGTWRPNRAPSHDTNINQRPLHNIPVQYTLFPDYLDYYPSYLDAILEKCIKDRSWCYEETAELKLPGEKNPHQ